jgi:hypothetical protein
MEANNKIEQDQALKMQDLINQIRETELPEEIRTESFNLMFEDLANALNELPQVIKDMDNYYDPVAQIHEKARTIQFEIVLIFIHVHDQMNKY